MARNLFFAVSKEDVLRTPWHHTGLGPLYACFVCARLLPVRKWNIPEADEVRL
jgi:hypothetical protein